MTLREALLQAGMKVEEIDNHYSDLYVLKNKISERVISEYEFKQNVKTFKSQIDGQKWYDIPFAYEEHFKEYTEGK